MKTHYPKSKPAAGTRQVLQTSVFGIFEIVLKGNKCSARKDHCVRLLRPFAAGHFPTCLEKDYDLLQHLCRDHASLQLLLNVANQSVHTLFWNGRWLLQIFVDDCFFQEVI